MRARLRRLVAGVSSLALVASLGTPGLAAPPRGAALDPPPAPTSALAGFVARYDANRDVLERRYPVESSSETIARFERFYSDWQSRLGGVDFDALGVEGRVDAILLRSRLEYELRLLARRKKRLAEAAPLLPFAPTILALNDARLRMETIDPVAAASTLAKAADQVDASRKAVEVDPAKTPRLIAFRAQEQIRELEGVLESWYGFYDGYDPLFTWWVAAPEKRLTAALDAYRGALREKVLAIRPGEDEPIVGTPIGRAAIEADLGSEFIPYTPEQLIAIAEKEFAWCDAEMLKASREMGMGDDWKAALEKVKQDYVPPGQQPDLIRDLAREAEAFLDAHDLITVPPLAKEVWRMKMMTPERQKVNPFFTGGEVISVSYPTDTMDQADKLMSLRGNNRDFARATVFHELIPGHHLQGFMTRRYDPYRRAFWTPFWIEGWSLYWEMLLWDMHFAKTPENKVGMLFWRMHRAARVIFSLRFHLGEWTPEQCIQFLVDRVGHERANAEAEVRRSFNGSYPPLYQLAYLMGGLQFKALHHELVDSGKMTNRTFHDAVMTGGIMPVELVRARLLGERLPKDYRTSWRFAGATP